jgi:hypothetical protein
MTQITDKMVEAAARSDAEFDERPFDSLSRADRDRYLARARKAINAAFAAMWQPIGEYDKTQHGKEVPTWNGNDIVVAELFEHGGELPSPAWGRMRPSCLGGGMVDFLLPQPTHFMPRLTAASAAIKQPIATAPKDGSWIRLFGGCVDESSDLAPENGFRKAPPEVIAYWDERVEQWVVTPFDDGWCAVYYIDPTHWMPCSGPSVTPQQI